MPKKFLDFFCLISLSLDHLVLRRKKYDDCLASSRCAAILMTYISVPFLCAVTAALKIVGFFSYFPFKFNQNRMLSYVQCKKIVSNYYAQTIDKNI